MNKKYILLLMVLLCLLAGCSNTNISNNNLEFKASSESENIDSNYSLNDIDTLYKKDKNYEILSNKNLTVFEYTIRDNNSDVMDFGYHDYRGSFDIIQENDFLTLNYGWGGSSWYERYYDVSNGRVSRFFARPAGNSNDLVAYFAFKEDHTLVLVIQDIFDSNVFYKEIKRDFSDFVIKIKTEAEFFDNDTKLRITYWINPDNEEVTEIIDL